MQSTATRGSVHLSRLTRWTGDATAEHFHTLALSKVSLYVYGLLVDACLGWLLVPSAIRLLRPPGSPMISVQGKLMGTVFVAVTSADSLALQFLVSKVEATFMLGNQWEMEAIAVVNTVVINTPQVFLFIALALLAAQDTSAEQLTSKHSG